MSANSATLQKFIDIIVPELLLSPDGVQLEQLKADLMKDRVIDADKEARQHGYETFKQFLESSAMRDHVQVISVNQPTVYKGRKPKDDWLIGLQHRAMRDESRERERKRQRQQQQPWQFEGSRTRNLAANERQQSGEMVNSLQSENVKLKSALYQKDRELDLHKAECARLSEELSKLRAECTSLTDKHSVLIEDKEKTNKEFSAVKQFARKFRDEKQIAENEIIKLKAELKSVKDVKLETVEVANASNTAASTTTTPSTIGLGSTTAQSRQLQEQVRQLTKEKEVDLLVLLQYMRPNFYASNQALSEQIAELEAERDEFHFEVEEMHQEELDVLAAENVWRLDKVDKALANSQLKNQKLEAEIKQVKEENLMLKEKIQELEQQVSSTLELKPKTPVETQSPHHHHQSSPIVAFNFTGEQKNHQQPTSDVPQQPEEAKSTSEGVQQQIGEPPTSSPLLEQATSVGSPQFEANQRLEQSTIIDDELYKEDTEQSEAAAVTTTRAPMPNPMLSIIGSIGSVGGPGLVHSQNIGNNSDSQAKRRGEGDPNLVTSSEAMDLGGYMEESAAGYRLRLRRPFFKKNISTINSRRFLSKNHNNTNINRRLAAVTSSLVMDDNNNNTIRGSSRLLSLVMPNLASYCHWSSSPSYATIKQLLMVWAATLFMLCAVLIALMMSNIGGLKGYWKADDCWKDQQLPCLANIGNGSWNREGGATAEAAVFVDGLNAVNVEGPSYHTNVRTKEPFSMLDAVLDVAQNKRCHPIFFYFELLVQKNNEQIVLGLSGPGFRLSSTDGDDNWVGKQADSFGIVSSNGTLWLAGIEHKNFGEQFGDEGDVMGCGLLLLLVDENNDRRPQLRRQLFFTKNGRIYGKPIWLAKEVSSSLYPTVGLAGTKSAMSAVEANFGANLMLKPFRYDLATHDFGQQQPTQEE